jgi:hypothetical protein
MAGDDGSGCIGRAVVDDDHVEAWVVERAGVAKALIDRCRSVVCAHDDADRGPVPVEVPYRSSVPAAGHVERSTRRSIGCREAKVPALHGRVAHPPLVREREHACTRDAAVDRGVELPIEYSSLLVLALRRRSGVDSHLPEHEWTIAGKVVQSSEVAAHVVLFLEEHVERQEVQTLERQVLGRRVVGVGDELAGILVVHDSGELADRVRHDIGAHPAQHVSRNLVAQRYGEDARIAGVPVGGFSDLALRVGDDAPEFPRRAVHDVAPIGIEDAGEQAKAMVAGRFDDVGGWRRVGADDGEPGRSELSEIGLDLRSVGIPLTVGSLGKCPICDAAKEEPFAGESEELSVTKDA